MKLTNEQKEIRKNALLIAKFEGFKVEEESVYGSIFYSDDNERTAIDTAYHNSENWLNPVSDKIDKILFDNVGKFGYSDECLHSDDLEVRYIAVVEFIEWYNKEINLDK
jgi:hypothetical protein